MSTQVKYVEGSAFLVLQGRQSRYGAWHELKFIRVVTKKPAVEHDEVALELRVKLPVALFEKPTLSASINVEGDVPQMDLSPETIHTIEDVIRSTSGLDVQLTLVEQSG